MHLRVTIGVALLVVGSSIVSGGARASQGFQQGAEKARKVVKSDREWAKQLTRTQYLVTRHKETEPAFSGKYATSHAKGYYACVCCGSVLFSSRTKFDSGTGWPSFFAPVAPTKLDTEQDFKLAEPRIEVMCNDCGAHLGHVFNDGPAPTGLRYCMNSASLHFLTEAQVKAAIDKEKAEQEKEKPKADPEKKAEAATPRTPE